MVIWFLSNTNINNKYIYSPVGDAYLEFTDNLSCWLLNIPTLQKGVL